MTLESELTRLDAGDCESVNFYKGQRNAYYVAIIICNDATVKIYFNVIHQWFGSN